MLAIEHAFTYQTALGPVWAVLLTLVGLPIANEIVQRFRGTRAESLLQGISLALLKIPYVGALVVKFPVVGDLLYIFAPQQKADLPKPLYKLAMDASKASNDNKLQPPSASATTKVVVLLFASSLSLTGCLPSLAACKIPTPVLVAKCTLENNLISCGEKSGFDMIPVVIGIVTAALAGVFDAAVLVADLESEGFKDIPCVLAAVESYLLPTQPAVAAKVHQMLVFKLKKDGMHGTVDMKLGSKVVHVVLGS